MEELWRREVWSALKGILLPSQVTGGPAVVAGGAAVVAGGGAVVAGGGAVVAGVMVGVVVVM